jgi:ABC-type uncharacterized transport system ATPase subunit
MNLIDEIRTKAKITIALITHNMNDVAEKTKRVVALHKGKIVFDGDPRVLFYDDKMLEDLGLKPPYAVSYAKKRGLKNILTFEELIRGLKKNV